MRTVLILAILTSLALAEERIEAVGGAWGVAASSPARADEIENYLAETDGELSADANAGAPWRNYVPIGGRKIREMGYEIPLPFGLNANLFYADRNFKIKELDVGVNGGDLQPVPDFVDIQVSGKVYNFMARFDAWVLPFLNLYLMAGYTWTDTLNTVTIDLPGPGQPITFDVPVQVEGPTYGVGLTLAFGYKWWFMAIDGNLNIADLNVADSEIRANIYSARTGWQGGIGTSEWKGALWVAYYYWDTENEVTGTVGADDGTQIQYKVVQGPEVPWNLALGGRVEFRENVTAMFE
ncbi:MAG: hypothetical protein ACYTEG_15235, partial [Planctomycetota bacterium]